MSETDKDLVFSEGVKAGKRIYYFDVKQSRNGDRYIAITESKKINEGTPENPRFVFQKHKLFLYKEDYEKFVDALNRMLDVAKGVVSVEEAQQAKAQREAAYAREEVAEEPQSPGVAEGEEKSEKKSFLDKVKDIF
ncbi:MAG: PUR family DNA/RNA-binding protein [Bacteroidaceae bacterium]|nr:PUR family DNA/RNA-binding protein [Bacteroidaceae bacterium]